MKTLFLVFLLLVSFTINYAQNNALNFDGVDDYVSIPANNAFDISSGTIECWIKPQALSSASVCILSNRGAGGTRYSFSIRNNGIGLWEGLNYFPLSYSFDNGVWYHLAFVSDGSGHVEFFVNGISIGQTSYGFSNVTGKTLIFGAVKEGSTPSQLFTGSIDEVRIWNTIRTVSQIQANKDIGLQGNETGLVALYSFGQGVASGNNIAITTLTSQTSTSLAGTLNNFALTGSNSNFVAGILADAPSSASLAWQLNGNSGTDPVINAIGTIDSQRLVFKTSNIEKMTLLPNGDLGIGTAVPDHRFSVVGGNGFKIARDGGTNYVLFEPKDESDWAIGTWNGGWGSNLFIDAKAIAFGARGSNAKIGIGVQVPQAALDVSGNIFASGKIAIGTTSLDTIGNYSLAVNGDAVFNKVRVKLYNTGWPDYVFKKSYKLPSLQSVAEYVRLNQHLPGVPTAATVQKDGIDVGDNQAVLLKKIEEVMLYLIEQNNRIEILENKILLMRSKTRK